MVYPKEYINSFVDWHDETTFLQSNEMYQHFIQALVGTLEGNTLILMKNIDPAKDLADMLKCTYISSKLSVENHLDHIYSIHYGFINNIPPYIIGHRNNLRLIPRSENSSKNKRCDITIDEILKGN